MTIVQSSKTPLKQSQVIIILNKSQGREYDTTYIYRVAIGFQLTLGHALLGSQRKGTKGTEFYSKLSKSASISPATHVFNPPDPIGLQLRSQLRVYGL